jgi:methionyl-tRNA synthetase
MSDERRHSLITTPIYYVNAAPHVGHAYTTIAADTLARARRLGGQEVFFLTGTDEHGQNIERIARERGIPEQQHCDEIAAEFRALWGRLDIRYDRFIRTTEEEHRRGVLKLWARLREAKTPDGQDAVYEGTYAGWYCPRCEGFKDEDELQQPDNVCPDHELPCEWTEEQNYFFRLSSYEDWLKEQISSDRLLIRPESRKNEILGVIRQGLKDFSVSRARVKWGIPVPEQPDHVLYVWVDALSNYITALGFADEDEAYRRFWAGADERLHMLGKDIIRFHCLYWPAVLHAAGLPVPTREFAQGFITKDGRKLSKTTGNIIDPVALAERFGPDAARYFLLREAPYGADWDFTDSAFLGRYNADLANDLGNLVSRALTMAAKYCDGKVPPRAGSTTEGTPGLEEALVTDDPVAWPHSQGLRNGVLARYEAIDFSGALAEIWSWISRLNQRIVAVEPWSLARDPARRGELDAFLYRLLEGVRLVAVLASPVMPRAAGRIFEMLGMETHELERADLDWGRLEPGTPLGTVTPLFPRVEKQKKEKAVTETAPPPEKPKAAAEAPADDRIDIGDFAKVQLKAAKVVEAERVEGSKKLLKLQVDLGSEQRQVVAGIAQTHDPEDLVGKTVILVANLKPAKLMGVESNGMVLAGSVDGKAVLCSFEAEVEPGTKVR